MLSADFVIATGIAYVGLLFLIAYVSDRQARSAEAEKLVASLAEQGVLMVATTFVDNAGITRVKTVPLHRLPQLAA